MRLNGIDFPEDRIADFCRRYGVKKLSLFGSVLRDDFRLDSDVDVLVEFLPETRIGLLGVAQMEIELSEMLHRSVDLRTPGDLSRYFRDEVIAQSRTLHAA